MVFTPSGSYVMVGFSSYLLARYSDQLPPRGVLIVECEEVIRRRRVRERAERVGCVGEVVSFEIQSRGGVQQFLRDFVSEGVQVVIPGVEYGVPGAALLANKLGLPGLGQRAAWALRDKFTLRTECARSGIKQPPFSLCESEDDARRFFSQHGPCVIKPTLRQGSMGVTVVGHPAQIQPAFHQASSVEEKARSLLADPDSVLVEGFAQGEEVSVEAFVKDGSISFFNVTEKSVFGGPFPVEQGHVVPAPVGDRVFGSLYRSMERLVSALQIETGVLHAEWILEDDGPTLVECAGRPPGDRITELIDLAYDMDFFQAFLDIHSGLTPRFPNTPVQAAAVEFLGPQHPATSFVGVDLARSMEGVHSVEMDVRPGGYLQPVRHVEDRAGSVIAVAPTPEKARARARAAGAAIQFLDTSPTLAERGKGFS